uniref:Uncharacterized protein n=1 Tax=uncultured marine virus TaxID=186617 RepID=A0A0F7L4M6_9VIRU|nr:hypothetical protein [uncultured marine virus]
MGLAMEPTTRTKAQARRFPTHGESSWKRSFTSLPLTVTTRTTTTSAKTRGKRQSGPGVAMKAAAHPPPRPAHFLTPFGLASIKTRRGRMRPCRRIT